MQESAATHKEAGSGEQGEGKDAYGALHEKTDWHLLFEKSRLWKQNIQIGRDEINEVLFQKINLKTDPSLLRVDITLKDGEKISPAFVSISRETGFKIKHLMKGEPIPREIILKDNFLRITIPADPQLFAREEVTAGGPVKPKPEVLPKVLEETTITRYLGRPLLEALKLKDSVTGKLRTEILLIYGVSVLIFSLFLGGILLLQ